MGILQKNLSKDYCNLNVRGTVYLTLTGLPLTLPGIHLGIALITRCASLSSEGSTLFTILISVREPSFSTVKDAMTRPWTPFSSATTGYFILFARKENKAAGPPGYCGISSNMSNVCLLLLLTLLSMRSLSMDELENIQDYINFIDSACYCAAYLC